METKMAGDGKKSKGWIWWVLVTVIGVLVIAAATLTILRDFRSKAPKVRSHHGPVVQKYADALGIAVQFFDVQKCPSTCPSQKKKKIVDVVHCQCCRCGWAIGLA